MVVLSSKLWLLTITCSLLNSQMYLHPRQEVVRDHFYVEPIFSLILPALQVLCHPILHLSMDRFRVGQSLSKNCAEACLVVRRVFEALYDVFRSGLRTEKGACCFWWRELATTKHSNKYEEHTRSGATRSDRRSLSDSV